MSRYRGRGRIPVGISLAIGGSSSVFPTVALSTTMQLSPEMTFALFLFLALAGSYVSLMGSIMMGFLGAYLGLAWNTLLGLFTQLVAFLHAL